MQLYDCYCDDAVDSGNLDSGMDGPLDCDKSDFDESAGRRSKEGQSKKTLLGQSKKTLLGIWRTNSLINTRNVMTHNVSDDGSAIMQNEAEHTNVEITNSEITYSDLYLEWSRFNHSCQPNLERVWRLNEGTVPTYNGSTLSTGKGFAQEGSQVLYAARDIQMGEELCGNFLGNSNARLVRAERRAKLLQGWKFLCECVACSGNQGRSFCVKSDSNRRRIGVLEDEIEEVYADDNNANEMEEVDADEPSAENTGENKEENKEAVLYKKVEELLKLYREENLLNPNIEGRLSFRALSCCVILQKPRETTQIWAHKLFENVKFHEGKGSEELVFARKLLECCESEEAYRGIEEVLGGGN
jgi:hypothetical protein